MPLIAEQTSTLDAGLLLGFLLIAAIIGGYAAVLVRVPRVVGYLVAGVLLRAVMAWACAHGEDPIGAQTLLTEAAEPLQLVKTLALGLIMFVIGNVFEVQHIKAVGARVLRISTLEIGCVIGLVGIACTLVWWFTAPPEQRGEAIAAGVLLGIVAVATAPAATLLVLREYDAKGPVSDVVLTLTAVNNTVSIVLFHSVFVVLCATGVITSNAAGERLVWLDLVLTSGGSMVLGGVLGFLFAVLYAKIALPEFLLVFFAALIGLGAGDDALAITLHLSFNFLLTCLFLGAVFSNITLDSGPLYSGLRTLASPLFACFFVMAGYELHLAELNHLGLLGVVYVMLRIAGKTLGAWWGARWAQWTGDLGSGLGLGLLCQAGVAIGLADFLADAWVDSTGRPHPFALQVKTVVLGSVVMFELLGPVVLKQVVKSAGEVKAVTLLRRQRAATGGGMSATRLAWEALLRTVGLQKTDPARAAGQLQVRHIMRSNIKFLRADAGLDEVLHYVESSRYNHFPVVDDHGEFVGMIHFGDLRNMIYDPHMRDLVTAIDLASPDDMVPMDLALTDLVKRFHESDVASLAVVASAADRRVVGLVEQRDLLRVLRSERTITDSATNQRPFS